MHEEMKLIHKYGKYETLFIINILY